MERSLNYWSEAADDSGSASLTTPEVSDDQEEF